MQDVVTVAHSILRLGEMIGLERDEDDLDKAVLLPRLMLNLFASNFQFTH